MAGVSGPALAADSTVGSIAELKAAVEALTQNEAATITLASGFAPVGSSPTITLPAGVDLTLSGEGEGTTVSKAAGTGDRHIDLTGNNTQTVALQHLVFEGLNPADPAGEAGGIPGGGVGIRGVDDVSVRESTFSGIDGSAGLALGGVKTLTVERSSFMGNRAAFGAAIELPSGIDAKISDTTMHKNWGTQPGYAGGALRPQRGTKLSIERSVFTENVSLTRGGAIAFHQMEGSLTVSDSVFDGNNVPDSTYNPSMHDGGAIALSEMPVTGPQLGRTTITGTTFSNNSAADEGGALLIQSGRESEAVITNSTFFNNSSHGLQTTFDDSSGGGAIEAFGTALTLELNTFVNNLAYKGNSIGHQRGGAVSATGDTQYLKAQPLTLSRNLFVGNDVVLDDGTPAPASSYRQVSARGGMEPLIGAPDDEPVTTDSPFGPEVTPEDRELLVPDRQQSPEDTGEDFIAFADETVTRGLNVGIDNGTTLDPGVNRLAVLGTDTPELGANGSHVTAGDERTDAPRTPGTILFHPRDDGFFPGLADNIGEDLLALDPPAALPAPSVAEDQRKLPIDNLADAGALQQAFIRYDPNGGDWADYGDTPFTGERIVQRGATAATVWSVGAVGSAATTEPAPTSAPADKTFAGWNTKPDGSGTAYPAGDISVPAGNLRLYAVWESSEPPMTTGTVTAKYLTDTGTTLRAPIVTTGTVGDTYTTEQLSFTGYNFVRAEGSISGSISERPTVVTYVYTAKETVKPPIVDPPGTLPPGDGSGPPIADTGLGLGWPLTVAGGAAILVAAGVLLHGRRRAGEGELGS